MALFVVQIPLLKTEAENYNKSLRNWKADCANIF